MKRPKNLFSKVKSGVIATFLLSGMMVFAASPLVLAADDVSCVKQGAEEKTSFKWAADGCANTTDLINTVINLFSVLVGIAVVGGIIYGGMLYATANGNSSKTQQGIIVIVNAVIALLLFIFMYAIANFLVPGGLIR